MLLIVVTHIIYVQVTHYRFSQERIMKEGRGGVVPLYYSLRIQILDTLHCQSLELTPCLHR